MTEKFEPTKKEGYHGKKLSLEEVSLLEQQGLVADIRNKLGSITSLISICELLESKDEKTRQVAQKMLAQAAKNSRGSVEHILASLAYSMQEKDPEKLKKLVEGHHGKE